MLSNMPVELNTHKFLQGGGKMGQLFRTTDWSQTALGVPDTWSESLRSAVSISLNSGFPIAIYWGEDFTILYNDAYSAIPGDKHPWAFGKPGAVAWSEIWDGLDAQFKSVLYNGESIRAPDALLLMNRYGYVEECYFDYTLSPIIAMDGSVGGVFNAVIETTYKVINERRNQVVYRFLQKLNSSRGLHEGLDNVNEILKQSKEDLPFCLLYSSIGDDPAGTRLTVCTGMTETEAQAINWPLPESGDNDSIHIENLNDYLVSPVNSPWSVPCHEALIVPISKGDAKVTGCMVIGISPRKKLDHDYTQFLESVGLHAGTLLNNGFSYELDEAYEREQALNEELAASNEELSAINEELRQTQESLEALNNELEARVMMRTRDVSAAHAEAESQRLRLKRFFMQAPAGICIMDGPDLVFEFINPAYQQLFPGRSMLGKPVLEAIPEIKGQPIWDVLQNVYTTGKTFEGSDLLIPMAKTDGGPIEERYFNFIYQARLDGDSEVDGILVFVFEVTENVLIRKKIEEDEKRVQFILNAMPQQVWTAKPDGALDYVNQVTCEDFGYTREEIVGQGWQNFIHPDDINGCLQAWQKALDTGNEYTFEFRLLMQNGAYIWHLSRALPLVEDGRIKLWVGTNTNIEIQKSNEQKKDEFLSIASHELKTPLTSIKAFNQLMQRSADANKLNGFVQKSAEHILRLEKLINDLLDVTKINAGKMDYTMREFSFKQMMLESIESVQHTASSHQIILQNADDVIYNGDQFRLEQVMNNFLTNAVKYSPEGEKVLVSSRVEQENIIVAIQDFGIGIAEDNLDRLFERYYRVDNTSMRFEGLGLGLFISSEILKRHQGSFWIESEQGKGSTFYFRLPLNRSNKAMPVVDTDVAYQNSFITINYNEANQRLDVDWTGFQNMESVQHGCLVLLKMLIKHQCNKIVNDNRNVLGTWSEAAEWVGLEWFPRAEEAGLKYLAWIFSNSAFSQLSAKKSIDVMTGSVVTQFFTDMQPAEEWINSK
jgi:PAS domain S-box-containing protein